MKRRLILSTLMVVAFIAAIAVLLLRSRTPAARVLPSPNGFDDFVEAGAAATANLPIQIADTNLIRQIITNNAEALSLVKTGLTRECVFPLAEFDADPGLLGRAVVSIKNAGRLLYLDGLFAESEGRTSDALDSYLGAIQLGNRTSRESLVIFRVTAIGSESLGYEGLVRLLPHLDAKQLQQLTAELEDIDSAWSSPRQIVRNSNAFDRRHTPASSPFEFFRRILDGRTARKSLQIKDQLILAKLRLLATECALRRFEMEKNVIPARLSELVPEFLDHVPRDPFTDGPLRYRPQTPGWILYSVGLDGVDNGGAPKTNGGDPTPGTDLFLE